MLKVLLFGWVISSSVYVFAQESQTKVNATSTKIEAVGQKKFSDSSEITDVKLKADLGSMSRYSLKFALSYFGPPVGDLSNRKQPNPDGSIGNYDTAIGGSISARYRLDGKSALSLGTGVNALTPFHGSERTDMKNPFLGYDRSSRVGNLQMRNAISTSVTTVPDYREVGQYGSLGFDTGVIYNLGASGVAIGVDGSLDYFLYEREYEKKDRSASRYHVSLYPQMKYNFSDKVNMYTSLAIKFANPRARSSEGDMLNKTLSQRLGMGVAFSRTVYFAPYLNFYPENFNWDSTTFSFATIFSIL